VGDEVSTPRAVGPGSDACSTMATDNVLARDTAGDVLRAGAKADSNTGAFLGLTASLLEDAATSGACNVMARDSGALARPVPASAR